MVQMRSENDELIDPSDVEDEEVSTTTRYLISSYGADYPVDSLINRLRSGDITIPTFQRAFVWTRAQASRFIESLLLGLPVPGIFLSKDPETQHLYVIDGQQRLLSLQSFYEGLISGKEFSLVGVSKEFEGKTYRTLAEDDKRRLSDSIIHATVVRQEKPDNDHSSIYMVFERLNTSGTPLSQQEIRACVYHGEFNNLLRKLNENKSWREIYGPESLRGKDQELILRAFALLFDAENYERPMKVFLSNFMGKNRHMDEPKRAELEKLFSATTLLLAEQVGAKAFRPERALNASMLETAMVGTSSRLIKGEILDKMQFGKAMHSLFADPKFLERCKFGTTHLDNVKERLAAVARALVDVK